MCRCVVADVMIQSAITKITLLSKPGADCCEMPLASLHPNKHKYTRDTKSMYKYEPASDLCYHYPILTICVYKYR